MLSRSELRTRVLTAVILLPIVVWFVYWGRLPFLILVGLLLTLAVGEYSRLVMRIGFRPILPFAVGLIWLSLLDAQFLTWDALRPGLSLILLGSLAWQLLRRQERTIESWALTVSGGLYLGLCGASLIRLRNLPPDGLWWTLIVLFAAFMADAGAHLIGLTVGRHKMAPVLSAGKTWEGYVGGLVSGSAAAALMTVLGRQLGGASIGLGRSWLVGVLIAALAPLGDLAISMIKRQANVKDSGVLFPGHGGALDRVDSLLWAAVLGYYYVIWFAI